MHESRALLRAELFGAPPEGPESVRLSQVEKLKPFENRYVEVRERNSENVLHGHLDRVEAGAHGAVLHFGGGGVRYQASKDTSVQISYLTKLLEPTILLTRAEDFELAVTAVEAKDTNAEAKRELVKSWQAYDAYLAGNAMLTAHADRMFERFGSNWRERIGIENPALFAQRELIKNLSPDGQDRRISDLADALGATKRFRCPDSQNRDPSTPWVELTNPLTGPCYFRFQNTAVAQRFADFVREYTHESFRAKILE